MPLPSKKPEINLKATEDFDENPKLYFPTKHYNGFKFLDADAPQINDDYIKSFNSCRIDERDYGSRYFWEKFKNSREVTIIDKHLSDRELIKIFNIVEYWEKNNLLTQIKFLSVYLYEPRLDNEIKDFYKLIKEKMCNKFKIYSTKREHDDLIHDRFAILDKETFHFGGTVGGYQKGFTAFSCGWSNKEIIKLFDYLIKNGLVYEVKNI